MSNFRIVFAQPWFLLLLIPALALTLIPYFRLSRRHRRTRNRITSIVLHLIVMFLATFTLAGMHFEYQIPNDENEIILLVDVSDSEEQAQIARDEFVELVLNDSKFDNYKVGVVTFGFDQRYAVPLTYEVEGIYDKYIDADLPDISATNVADALTYTASLFGNPQTGKIVLITDGKETDNEDKTYNLIRSVVAQGTKVDVAYVPSEFSEDWVQLTNVELPETHINAGEDFPIKLVVQSKEEVKGVKIELFDNGVLSKTMPVQNVDLIKGTQTVLFTHNMQDQGFHEILFKITLAEDGLEQNNEYRTYMNLEMFNKILIIERADESQALVAMLNNEKQYDITVQNIKAEGIPETVDDLRVYDQVILNNISYADMEQAYQDKEVILDVLLETYVNEYGGGLFTVGGNDETGKKANAYNRMDLSGTVYQQMLPVQAIDYTPPIGVVFILDKSGSMTSTDRYNNTYLDLAKSAIANCLAGDSEESEVAVFSSRDYVGLMTLDSEHELILELTSCAQKDTILTALNGIDTAMGGTVFGGALQRAGQLLRSLPNVDKRHIVIVTDGGVDGGDKETYLPVAEDFYKTSGITCSVLGIDMQVSEDPNSPYGLMKELTDTAHGKTIAASAKEVTTLLRAELSAPEINEVNIPEGGFSPIIHDATSILVRGLETGEGAKKNELTMKLDGFYGVKVRDEKYLVLVGDYEVPIYAQWKYGKGMVGSFMCDLNGVWSANFMQDKNGQQFVKNVVNNLMPIANIRPSEISVISFKEDNYTNTLQIEGNLAEGELIKGEIYSMSNDSVVLASLNEVAVDSEDAPLSEKDVYVKMALNEESKYSHCVFVAKTAGVYKIVLHKYKGDLLIDTLTIYKSVSYSEEYISFVQQGEEEISYVDTLKALAKRGEGAYIEDLEDPWQIFSGFITALDKSYDPRFVFMIVAICLFLLDIAVRKFKFKWPHEIIRAIKNKKNSK